MTIGMGAFPAKVYSILCPEMRQNKGLEYNPIGVKRGSAKIMLKDKALNSKRL